MIFQLNSLYHSYDFLTWDFHYSIFKLIKFFIFKILKDINCQFSYLNRYQTTDDPENPRERIILDRSQRMRKNKLQILYRKTNPNAQYEPKNFKGLRSLPQPQQDLLMKEL